MSVLLAALVWCGAGWGGTPLLSLSGGEGGNDQVGQPPDAAQVEWARQVRRAMSLLSLGSSA
jgi:hypothetical protein